jgi:hypothetical protein
MEEMDDDDDEEEEEEEEEVTPVSEVHAARDCASSAQETQQALRDDAAWMVF